MKTYCVLYRARDGGKARLEYVPARSKRGAENYINALRGDVEILAIGILEMTHK